MRAFAVALVCCFGAAVTPSAVLGQAHTESTTRQAGTFLATATLAAAGAAAGFVGGAAISSGAPQVCVPEAMDRCGGSEWSILYPIGGAAVGAAVGATLGARLMGRRQSLLRSALGAGLGMFVGGALAGQLDLDSEPSLAVSILIPTGLFAAWVGR